MQKSFCHFLEDRTDETDDDSDAFWGFPIAGYEKEPGPLFVFARVHSHMTACEIFRAAFDAMREKQQREQPVWCGTCEHCRSGNPCPEWNRADFPANLQGDAAHMQSYIRPRPTGVPKEAELRSIMGDSEDGLILRVHSGGPAGIGINFVIAGVIGIFLQWGTTGSAILIAYM